MNRFLRTLQRFHGRSMAEDGMTMIEIMIAMFILAVAVLALASTAVTSLTTLRISRERQTATAAATAAIEEVRALGFRDVAIDDAEVAELSADSAYITQGNCPQPSPSVSAYCFDPDGSGPTPPEEIIVSNSGGVTDYKTIEDSGRLTVRRFVTWLNRDVSTPSAKNARRMTTVVVFTDAGSTERSVLESTVVAEAERGLPVPQFDITPRVVVAGMDDGVACFSHLLRNIGADDRYDVELWKASKNAGTYSLDGASPSSTLEANKSTMRARGWGADAWFGEPAYTAGEPAPSLSSGLLWKDVTGDFRPDSPVEVESGERRSLTFCYRPRNSSDSEFDKRVFAIKVRSAFDSTVAVTLFHDIASQPGIVTVYLHHEPVNDGTAPDICDPQDRAPLGSSSTSIGDEQFKMDRKLPEQRCPSSSDPAVTELTDFLYDYDRDVDSDGLPGLWQRRGSTTHRGVWEYQVTQEQTFSDAQLFLYSAHAGAFSGSTSTPTLSYAWKLEKVETSGGSSTVTPLASSFPNLTYVHDQPSWKEVSVGPVTLNSDATFSDANEFVRLTVWCVSSNNDCHLAYDTNTYRARLVVGVAP